MKWSLPIFYVAGAITTAWYAIQWGRLSLGYEPLGGEPPQAWVGALVFACGAYGAIKRALELAKGEADD